MACHALGVVRDAPEEMFSTKENIQSLTELLVLLREHVDLQLERMKLDAVSRLAGLVAVLAVLIVSLVCASAVVLFLSLAAVVWLQPALGWAGACLLVAAVYAVLALAVYAMRRRLIINPMTNVLGHMLLDEHAPAPDAPTSTSHPAP